MDIFQDMLRLYTKFDFPIPDGPCLINKEFMNQRLNFILEELNETADAVYNEDIDEVIDGLIDIIVVAAGNLTLMGVDGQLHWNEVLRANMAKERGTKPGRVMQIDLRKPEGWKGPNHRQVRALYE